MSGHYSEILDQAALDELNNVTGGDPEFMADLVNTFLDDAPKLIGEMQAALSAGNASEVRRIAHGLKSNGRDFGAVEFTELCKTLEHDAADGQLSDGAALVANIQAEFPRVKAALEAYLNS